MKEPLTPLLFKQDVFSLTQGSTGQGGISAQLLSALFGLQATPLLVLQAADVWPAEHLTGTLFLMVFSRLGPCGLEVQALVYRRGEDTQSNE